MPARPSLPERSRPPAPNLASQTLPTLATLGMHQQALASQAGRAVPCPDHPGHAYPGIHARPHRPSTAMHTASCRPKPAVAGPTLPARPKPTTHTPDPSAAGHASRAGPHLAFTRRLAKPQQSGPTPLAPPSQHHASLAAARLRRCPSWPDHHLTRPCRPRHVVPCLNWTRVTKACQPDRAALDRAPPGPALAFPRSPRLASLAMHRNTVDRPPVPEPSWPGPGSPVHANPTGQA